MWNSLKSRMFQGYRTGSFPGSAPVLPERFAGRHEIIQEKCSNCGKCVQVCPSGAVEQVDSKIVVDTGKCIFCSKCAQVCSSGALSMSKEYRLAAMSRKNLVVDGTPYIPERATDRKFLKFCGNSLKIRQVSAGGCAACELDFNVLNTLAWDMGRFGIQVVASPRHADCILVTGPVSENMLLALKKSYDAAPRPVWVIACGSCAISGGIYAGSEVCHDGVEEILKPDLYVPGCPPHPATLLEGILRLMNKVN